MGPGGLGKELEGALGNVVAANGTGNGGWSIKGNGAGGPGGDPAQIGAIGVSGVANKTGIGTLCHGPGPCKSSEEPKISDDPPIVCSNGGEQCMDKELIRKVINGHRDQIRFCYELALQQAPSLAGKVAVQFAVGESGNVAVAKVDQNTSHNATLGDCLVSRVRTWQFPMPRRSAGFRVTYPFVFKPAGG
jgi:TonB family protein